MDPADICFSDDQLRLSGSQLEHLFNTVIFPPLCALGIVGNTLTIMVLGKYISHVSGGVRCVPSDSDDTALDGAFRLFRLQSLLSLPLPTIQDPPGRVCQLVVGCFNMVAFGALRRQIDFFFDAGGFDKMCDGIGGGRNLRCSFCIHFQKNCFAGVEAWWTTAPTYNTADCGANLRIRHRRDGTTRRRHSNLISVNQLSTILGVENRCRLDCEIISRVYDMAVEPQGPIQSLPGGFAPAE
ncbi:unnamed protein product [Nippostrongylus brasiliensis]|uniref:G_PROTEIN_RECEP_F1_2 domain-containing protein n=1 Tax=Nippostrongylus brasiliensis TaxID=27835 RepID=A0A0N4Y1H0_NIPBR|nr:unnamed protein product [Nippostrongylus brasiliensis]